MLDDSVVKGLIIVVLIVLVYLVYTDWGKKKLDLSYIIGEEPPSEGFTPVFATVPRGADSRFNRNPYYAGVYPFLRPSYSKWPGQD